MREPSPMPEAVIDAIFSWAGVKEPHRCSICGEEHGGPAPQQLAVAYGVLRRIRWDSLNDCYGFEWPCFDTSVYVGIELDGYLHT